MARKQFPNRLFSLGVTLVELMVTIGILGITAFMCTSLIQFFHGMSKQKILLAAERNAQVVLYNINTDVWNSQQIISISPDSLVLRAYDFKRWIGDQTTDFSDDFNNSDAVNGSPMFKEVNFGTVTYSYAQASTCAVSNSYAQTDNCLVMMSQFPGRPDQKLVYLKNMFAGSPGGTDYMFRQVDSSTQTVDIALRLQFPYLNNLKRTYQCEAMSRSGLPEQ